MSAPEFIAIGHVTIDRFGAASRPGGAALYAAITAHRLGLSAGLLTSHGDDFPLERLPPQIEVVCVPAAATAVFEHGGQAGSRELRLASRAAPLAAHDVPGDWGDAGLVLLAPVAAEVDPLLAVAFPEATMAAAAQGWLRGVGQDGRVRGMPWESPALVLDRVQALFVSREDVRGQESAVTEWVQRVPIVVVTAGAAGSLLYVNGERYEIRPRPAREVDATGAGDVFAAAFLVRYRATGDAWDAAEAAACAASLSVEAPGWEAVPDAAALEAALGQYRRTD